MSRSRYNFLRGTLAAAVSDTDTAFVINTGDWVDAPLVTGDYYAFSVEDEIVYVTNFDGVDTMTVERGREGTTAVAHDAGTEARHVLTAWDLGINGHDSFDAPYWVSDAPTYDEVLGADTPGLYAKEYISGGVGTFTYSADSTAETYLTPTGYIVTIDGVTGASKEAGIQWSSRTIKRTRFGFPTAEGGNPLVARVLYRADTGANAEVRFHTAIPGGPMGTTSVLPDAVDWTWSDWIDIVQDPEMWAFAVYLASTGTATPVLDIAGMQVKPSGALDPIPDAKYGDQRGGEWQYRIDQNSGNGRWMGSRPMNVLYAVYSSVEPVVLDTSGVSVVPIFLAEDFAVSDIRAHLLKAHLNDPGYTWNSTGIYLPCGDYQIMLSLEDVVSTAGTSVTFGLFGGTDVGDFRVSGGVVGPDTNAITGSFSVRLLSPAEITPYAVGSWTTGTGLEGTLVVEVRQETIGDLHYSRPSDTCDITFDVTTPGEITWDIAAYYAPAVLIQVFSPDGTQVDSTSAADPDVTGTFTVAAGTYYVVTSGYISGATASRQSRLAYRTTVSVCVVT